jgi:hypothetical protein
MMRDLLGDPVQDGKNCFVVEGDMDVRHVSNRSLKIFVGRSGRSVLVIWSLGCRMDRAGQISTHTPSVFTSRTIPAALLPLAVLATV